MKKVFFVLVLLLLMPIVVMAKVGPSAQNNTKSTIVVDFGKHRSVYAMSFEEMAAINYLFNKSIMSFNQDGCIYRDGKKLICTGSDRNTFTIQEGIGAQDNFTYDVSDNFCEQSDVDDLCEEILGNVRKIEVKFDGESVELDTLYFPVYDKSKFVSEPGSYFFEDIMYILMDDGMIDFKDAGGHSLILNSNGDEIMSFSYQNDFDVLPEATIDDNMYFDVPSNWYGSYEFPSNIKYIKIDFVEDTSNLPVHIKKIELDSTNAKVNSYSSDYKLNVSSDVSFKYTGDYVKYKITLENNDDDDYKVSLGNVSNEYIDYIVDYPNGDRVVKANSETIVYLTIKYTKQVPEELFNNGEFRESKDIELNLVTGNNNSIKKTTNILKNPKTAGTLFMIILLIATDILVFKLVGFKKTTVTIILLTVMLSLPLSVYALKTITVTVNSTINITYRDLGKLYMNGVEVNLAGRGIDVCTDSNTDVVNIDDNNGNFTIRVNQPQPKTKAALFPNLIIFGHSDNNKVIVDDVDFNSDITTIEALKTINNIDKIKEYLGNYYTEHGLPICSTSTGGGNPSR
ncbi:MAG: hypothetical protein IJI43_00560 [Bacilli bacterium]|nr:hypothetical protein [Bacilli bacterium]